MELCGHTIFKKCHEKTPNCTFKCTDRLVCGHACERNCHKNDDPDHEMVIFMQYKIFFNNNCNYKYLYINSINA